MVLCVHPTLLLRAPFMALTDRPDSLPSPSLPSSLGTMCYGVVGDVINPPTNLQLCILASPAYQVNVTVGTITLVNAVFNTAIIYV